MKKVLLATTAVALSAGVAAADVSVSGNARMGLQYKSSVAAVAGGLNTYAWNPVTKKVDKTVVAGVSNPAALAAAKDAVAAAKAAVAAAATDAARTLAEGNLAAAEAQLADRAGVAAQASNTTIEKRMNINLDGSVETSSGMTFGARMRLRSNEAGATLTTGARVYMKTGGVEIAMGNINGAIESMPGLYDPSVGLTGLGWGGLVTNTRGKGYWGWDAYSSSGNGVEGVEVMYSGGSFTGHLSYSEPVLSSGATAEERIALYGAYTMNDWTVALGLQDSSNNANDKVVLTVGGKLGDYSVGFGIADNDGVQKIALNGSATFGATTVSAYVADEDTAVADTSYGIGVSYDLGGASVVGGISHDAFGTDRADLGVSFSF